MCMEGNINGFGIGSWGRVGVVRIGVEINI